MNLPRCSYILLHLTLGLVVLVESVQALIHALHAPSEHLHLGGLATIEIVAALLFLWPRTVRVGGLTLVVIFLVAVVAHGLRGDFPAALLVYAAAAGYVAVHGSAWTTRAT